LKFNRFISHCQAILNPLGVGPICHRFIWRAGSTGGSTSRCPVAPAASS